MAGGARASPSRARCLLTAPARLQIGILANKGISATDIKKLKDYGLHTVADIQHTTTKKMLNIKGLSEAKVTKIKDVAKSESGNSFMSGSELVNLCSPLACRHLWVASTFLSALAQTDVREVRLRYVSHLMAQTQPEPQHCSLPLSFSMRLPVSRPDASASALYA